MSDVKWTIGIESTAHTFSFGLVDPNGIPYPSVGDTIKPLEGGIHPREVADHHRDYALQNCSIEYLILNNSLLLT